MSARRCACAAGYAGLALTELRYSQAARAVELANAIGSVTGARLHIDEDLRARSFGDWESLSRGAMRSAWDAQAESYWADPAHWKPPGGESHAQLEERALRAFERCQPNAGETALIICHGEVMRAITAAVLGMPLERLAVLGTPPGLGILLRDHAKGWSLERTGARPDEKRASDLVP